MNNIKVKKDFFKFSTKDYILYILNMLKSSKSDKIRLNKIAFFVEFAYIFFNNHDLSSSKYAAIDKGPVIDQYDTILKEMEKENLIVIDGYLLRPLVNAKNNPSKEVENFIRTTVEKYENLSKDELISLSHQTDSYKITTDNENKMGNIINKKFASLETFFYDGENNENINDEGLPVFDKSELVEYDF